MTARSVIVLTLICITPLGGCLNHLRRDKIHITNVTLPPASLLEIEYPDLKTHRTTQLGAEAPRTLRDMEQVAYWNLTLQEAVHIALMNSKVLRDLGGTVVRSPNGVTTSLDPAVVETDPRTGVEAALSAFDAQLQSTFTSEKIDRRLNNRFVGNLGFLTGQVDTWDAEINKRAATGTQFALRRRIEHERDNNPGNEFPDGAWNVWYEGEARHPLLQGGGLKFNRIAGPNATPGVYNGVLVARIRTDVSLADFEIGLRDFVSNVENCYWDLYYAYRDLDAKLRARNAALETWRRIEALNAAGRRGGEAEKEAQSREQYFRFEADAQDSLAGRPLDGTRTNNGSLPGTFRGIPGVLVNEKRLRLIMNVPAEHERLICPIDEPPISAVRFDWDAITAEGLSRRAELRRQQWEVKRRELELLATKNFLLPRLDSFGRYRMRGFGDSLIDPDSSKPRFDNAYQDLTDGEFAEWQLGLEFSAPLGFRQAHVNVHNAELRLARERALLQSQEREIIYALEQAIAEMDRSFLVMQTNFNRFMAARQQVAAVDAAYKDDRVELIAVLDAQRRLAEAESQHFKSRSEYAVALKNVHFEKGTLLDYNGVASSEGPWPAKAYQDAADLSARRGRPWRAPASAIPVSTGVSPPALIQSQGMMD